MLAKQGIAAGALATIIGGTTPGIAATHLTLYAGPSTYAFLTHDILHGSFHVDGAMVGVALDHTLLELGHGFALLGEVEATHYLFEHPETTLSAGLGIGYRLPVGSERPITVQLYMGPSFALDPFVNVPGNTPGRHPWLNFTSAVVTIDIPHAPHWSIAFRAFHRSGAYGLYVKNFDEGSMVGVGIRYRL